MEIVKSWNQRESERYQIFWVGLSVRPSGPEPVLVQSRGTMKTTPIRPAMRPHDDRMIE